MIKKSLLFLVIFLNSCMTPSIVEGNSLLLNDKLQNTEWTSKKNSVTFYDDRIQVKIGNLLGTSGTPFEIVDQDSEYVVYLIFRDVHPTLVGVVQVDHKHIKLLWWPASNFDPKVVKTTVDKQGMKFKIRKKVNP